MFGSSKETEDNLALSDPLKTQKNEYWWPFRSTFRPLIFKKWILRTLTLPKNWVLLTLWNHTPRYHNACSMLFHLTVSVNAKNIWCSNFLVRGSEATQESLIKGTLCLRKIYMTSCLYTVSARRKIDFTVHQHKQTVKSAFAIIPVTGDSWNFDGLVYEGWLWGLSGMVRDCGEWRVHVKRSCTCYSLCGHHPPNFILLFTIHGTWD